MPGSMAIQRETLWGQPTDVASGKPIPHVYHYRATEMGDGRLFLEAQLIAPKQAIDATLGPGTCRDNSSRFNAWVCSECGATLLLTFDDFDEPSYSVDGIADLPRFCPNCGRKVVSE